MLADSVVTGLPFLKVEDVQSGCPMKVWCRLEAEAVCPRCGGRQLRVKGRKRVLGARQPLPRPDRSNQV